MRSALAAVLLGLLMASVTGAWLAMADSQGKVIGTSHDLGAATTHGVSACEVCHVPHEGGGEALWDGNPRPEGPLSGLAPQCYSCHDGTVATGAYVFGADLVQHPVKAGEPGEDCDMCHDPHASDYGSYLLFPSGANLCQICHAQAVGGDHPVNVDTHEVGYAPADASWDPDHGDLIGARLWDAGGVEPGGYLKCLSCHSAHGATSGTALLTMGYKAAPGAAPSLCLNCHPEEEAP